MGTGDAVTASSAPAPPVRPSGSRQLPASQAAPGSDSAPPTEPVPIPVDAVTAARFASNQANRLTNLMTTSLVHTGAPGACRWHHAKAVGMSDDGRAALAWIVADNVMKSRGGNSTAHALWRNAAMSGIKLTGTDLIVVQAFMEDVFGLRGQPKAMDHIVGHVGEWIWYLHASELAEDTRTILWIEPPKFSVTEPGADGLIVYASIADGGSFFRLWEMKKKTGSGGTVSGTVGEAYQQLTKYATKYLAKLTASLSREPGTVGAIGRELVELWVNASDRAGVGVSVATDRVPPPARCFSTMGSHFDQFGSPGQLEGLLLTVEDLPQVAATVREYLWTAL